MKSGCPLVFLKIEHFHVLIFQEIIGYRSDPFRIKLYEVQLGWQDKKTNPKKACFKEDLKPSKIGTC